MSNAMILVGRFPGCKCVGADNHIQLSTVRGYDIVDSYNAVTFPT
jgi:hypothetical protein